MTAGSGQRKRLLDRARRLNGNGSIVAGLVLAWIGWMVSDMVSVDLAFGETYRHRIDVVGWRDTWPLLRWIPGWVGILAVGLPNFWGRSADRSRALPCLALAAVLLALRIVSFIPGLGVAVPALGLVWTVHVSWALSLVLLFYALFPKANDLLAGRRTGTGAALLVTFGILYTVFAGFFVRTTLLHGDEPQYLLITQSLLHDGDIDLSNTTQESILEFHQKNVQPRAAPASPPDRIHSAHPVGLAALFVPFYWLGLATIGHPRLACALLVAITSALAIFLAHRWLLQQGVTPAGALLATVGVGISPLMFLFSNQLYPEIFAVVASLSVLMTLGASLPKTRPRLCAFAIALVLVALPLFHQRLLPLCVLLGFLTYLEYRELPEHVSILKGVGVILTLGVAAHVLYHVHFSGDIWGPYKPGNADVLDFEHLPTALFGQWLDVQVGLLNNSPIFLGSLIGVAAMALSRDRRLAIVIGIYATTACVNALSNDWRFGYCLPSRFMLTALPALLIPLALTIDRALNQSIVMTFVLVFGLCVGWDSNYQALALTEGAYDGAHLIYRALDQMYPVGIHLPLLEDVATVPWLDVGAWAGGVAILVSLGRYDNGKLALLMVGLVAIVPVLASSGYAERLKTLVAPGLSRFSSREGDVEVRSFRQKVRFGTYNGTVQEGDEYVARPSSARAGVAGYSGLPHIYPSVYESTLPATASSPVEGLPGASYVLTRRYGVRAQLNHQTRYAVPLGSDKSAASVRLVESSGRGIVQHFVMYEEGADLRFGDAKLTQLPVQLRETHQLELSRQLDLDTRDGKGFYHGFTVVDLEPGFYRFDVEVEHVDASVWIDRQTDPVMITLFADVKDLQDGRERARAWRPMLGRAIELPILTPVERPSVEAYLSPFWATVPFADQMKFNFENDRRQTFYVEIYYPGQHGLVLRSIDLHRRSFTRRDGSSFRVDLGGTRTW